MKTSISKMLSRVIALALVFCLSVQMMPLQIMANDYRNKQLDKQIADKQSEIEKLETEVENILGHEIGVNAAAEAQSAPVMMAANTDDIVTVDRPVSYLSRFRKGDCLRHIKGTKYLQACRPNGVRDCVMCGCIVRESGNECPHCGFSLVKFELPEDAS